MSDSVRKSTEDRVNEQIEYDSGMYGSSLECGVPKQKPVYDGELEYQIREYYRNVRKMIPGQNAWDYDSEERCRNYKKSVTFRKIADLHRWGFRMAEKYIPDNHNNRVTLSSFISYWNEFTKENQAEKLNNLFRGITFFIYKDNNGGIIWYRNKGRYDQGRNEFLCRRFICRYGRILSQSGIKTIKNHL